MIYFIRSSLQSRAKNLYIRSIQNFVAKAGFLVDFGALIPKWYGSVLRQSICKKITVS
jgi:hypothetical protein